MSWQGGPGGPYGQQPGGYDPNAGYGQQYEHYEQPYSGQPYEQPYSADPYAPVPYQPPVQQPPYQAYPQPRGTNTMAIMSLIFSLVSLFVIPIIGSVLGIVFGHIGKKQIKETGEDGEGMATAGLIIGYISTGLWVLGCCGYLVLVVGVFGFAASQAGKSGTYPSYTYSWLLSVVQFVRAMLAF